jgi:hypothetical protein
MHQSTAHAAAPGRTSLRWLTRSLSAAKSSLLSPPVRASLLFWYSRDSAAARACARAAAECVQKTDGEAQRSHANSRKGHQSEKPSDRSDRSAQVPSVYSRVPSTHKYRVRVPSTAYRVRVPSTSDRREKDDDRRQRARAEQNPEDPLHLKRTAACNMLRSTTRSVTGGMGQPQRACVRQTCERACVCGSNVCSSTSARA